MNTNTPTLHALTPEWVGVDIDPHTGAWFNVFADGTRLPVCAGAAPEEEGGDNDDAGDNDNDNDDNDAGAENDDNDDDQGEEEDEEDVIKLSRAEYEKAKERHRRANKESARRRKWLEKAGIDPHTGKPKKSVLDEADDEEDEDEDDDEVTPPKRRRKTSSKPVKKNRRRQVEDDDEDEVDEGPDLDELEERWTRKAERAAEKAATRAEMKYKIPLAKSAAKAALADAGWTGKNFEKVMRLIELDDVELDDDGEILGIDDQVDGIKEEFPDWFRRRSPSSSSRGGSGRKNARGEGKGSTKDVGGSGQTGKKEKKDWKQSLADQAFKG